MSSRDRRSSSGGLPPILAERYAVTRELGRGGMAVILEANDSHTGEAVALKLLQPNQVNNFDAVLRFEREGAVIAEVEHVNLVRVLDRGRHRDLPFIVLELVNGPTVKDYVEQNGPLVPQLALSLTWQATQGLAALHRSDIVHRDIKPANILLELMFDVPQTVKIADFGFIQVGTERLTDPGNVLGTTSCMAPEQILSEAVDRRADIYALGVTLYFMLTGTLPFNGESGRVMAQHLLAAHTPPSRLNPAVTPAADAIVACALRKAPANRYATADALAQDIQRASPQGAPLSVSPDHYAPTTQLGTQALAALRARYG